MKSSLIAAITLFSTSIFAQNFGRVDPTSEKGKLYEPSGSTTQLPDGDQVIISCLKGIILTDESSLSSEEKQRAVGGLDTLNIQVPGKLKYLKSYLSYEFLQKPLTKQRLLDLKQEILMYYRRQGRPVVTLQIPQQKVTDGVLQILVIEGKLGQVKVEGNTHFKSHILRNYIQLKEGQPIDSQILLTDVAWINRNPFRHVDVVFGPGDIAGTTDIRLLTNDSRPWKVYTGVDNTGYDKTSLIRLFTGANWGKIFNLDHTFSMQLTHAPDIRQFWSLIGYYSMPLPWRHILSFYGGYSHVHTKIHPKSSETTSKQKSQTSPSGYSVQASTRYNIILKPIGTYLQDVIVGADYKRTNTGVDHGKEMQSPMSSNLTQLMSGYNGAFDSSYIKFALSADLFYSPGKWLPNQSSETYDPLHRGATPHYFYGRFSFTPVLRLPKDFSFALNLEGQVSTQNLLPSEQYGLGGHNTVRGYKERIVNADNAFFSSTELRSPPLSFIGKRAFKDVLQLLLFLDYGIGGNVHQDLDKTSTQYLLSYGPGVRYNISPYMTFKADLGIKLNKIEKKLSPIEKQTIQESDTSPFRFHFSFIASY